MLIEPRSEPRSVKSKSRALSPDYIIRMRQIFIQAMMDTTNYSKAEISPNGYWIYFTAWDDVVIRVRLVADELAEEPING